MSAQPNLDTASEGKGGQCQVLVCQNKTCKQQGSPQVLAAFRRCVPAEITVEPSGCLGQCGNGPMAIVLTELAESSEPTKTWYSHLQPADAFAISAQHFKQESSLTQKQSSTQDAPSRSIGIWIVGIILFLSLCALMAVVVGGPSHYG